MAGSFKLEWKPLTSPLDSSIRAGYISTREK
jgi:hypothetical protein